MAWNWQISGWPDFRYDAEALAPFEKRFLLSSGEILGAVHHVSPSERDQLRIDLLSDEAVKTSAIEGEMLDRLSVQSSLRRQLGLAPDNYPNKPREEGVAEMMVDVYSTYAEALTHENSVPVACNAPVSRSAFGNRRSISAAFRCNADCLGASGSPNSAFRGPAVAAGSEGDGLLRLLVRQGPVLMQGMLASADASRP